MEAIKTDSPYTRRSKQEWQQLVEECESSDQSSTEFCQQRQLSYQSFIKWRSTFRAEVRNANSAFVEISPEDKAMPAIADWAVELQIGDNVVLRIRQPQ